MVTVARVREVLERLTGQQAPLTPDLPDTSVAVLSPGGSGLGYSQLNELLILFGFDRVTQSFFQLLVDGSLEYQPGSSIASLDDLQDNVEAFRQVALLLFGNVKYAFKQLSRDDELLRAELDRLQPIPESRYRNRHDPVRPIEPIPSERTYLLGYLIECELRERLSDPDDSQARLQEEIRLATVAIGKRNHDAYLASDHLDVYVATSMRERHEYAAVAQFAQEVFTHSELADLKLRWFDPTQAYCHDRIDKGLAEALMLKRAKCTVYLAQETDTLGKDSELASTLAQGKPVIAFVPEVTPGTARRLLTQLEAVHPGKEPKQLILDQLRALQPNAAWLEPRVRDWAESVESMDFEEGLERLQGALQSHFDKRADTLRNQHPLGIQVHLATGVANGVLVVRTLEQCARLIKAIVTGTLTFAIEETEHFLLLRDQISGSVYRVSTRDEMLSNAFWNFYLEPSEPI